MGSGHGLSRDQPSVTRNMKWNLGFQKKFMLFEQDIELNRTCCGMRWRVPCGNLHNSSKTLRKLQTQHLHFNQRHESTNTDLFSLHLAQNWVNLEVSHARSCVGRTGNLNSRAVWRRDDRGHSSALNSASQRIITFFDTWAGRTGMFDHGHFKVRTVTQHAHV